MCFFSKISSKYASAVSYFDGLVERDTFLQSEFEFDGQFKTKSKKYL
jgi:hypothetical protein